MLFISRTLSRQHPFPLVGKRPAIASNVASERPATTVETLIKTNSGAGNNGKSFLFKLDDGQQGWYRLTLASNTSPTASANNGAGSKIDYRFYMCPGSMIQYWPSSGSFGGKPDRATSSTNDIPSSCFGASGTPYSNNSTNTGGAGAGAGYPSSSIAGFGGGGAGFIVSLIANCEYKYNTRANIKVRTLFGYSDYISFSFVNTEQETISMLRTPGSDGASGYAWIGSVEEGGEEPTPLICYTETPTIKEGAEVTIYRSDDLVDPYIETTVVSVNKNTLYQKRRTAPTDATTVQYRFYTTTGSQSINNPSSTGTDAGIRYIETGGKKYYVDEDVVASYERQNYYAWEATDGMGLYNSKGRIIWTNTTNISNGVGRNGVWAYEKCGDNMCISMMKYPYSYLTRRSDLDTIGNRVAIGTSTYLAEAEAGSGDYVDPRAFTNDTEMATLIGGVTEVVDHYTVPGTGTYLMCLCGGGGYYDVSTIRNGGAALGSITPRSSLYTQQSGGYSYTTATGPGETLGGSFTQNGAACIIDMNDCYIDDNRPEGITNEIFGKNTSPTGDLKLYKITDSSAVTKYSQKIYFEPSDRNYTAVLTLNGVATTVTIKKSLSVTEYFLLDVKQGDSLTIELIGDGGSTISNAYVISTETIAFGINPGSAPWKEREYTSPVSNVLLAFSPSYKYGAILVAGGGAGGDGGTLRHSARTPGVGGAGETSLIRTIKFTPNDSQIAKITVGSGGVVSSDPNSNGGTSANADYANVHGGDGGRPTFITFPKKVTINSSNYRPTYAYSVKNTTTNAVGYTIHTYPSTDGQLVSFYFKTSSRLEDGTDKGYFLNGHLVDISTGETWEFCNESNQANQTFLNVKDIPLKAIFCEGTGGGGGGGGGGINSRKGTAGAGGAGGGYYRFNYENSTVQSVPGRGSSSPNGGAGYTGNTIERFIVANVDWTYLTACAGKGDSGQSGAGGNGGQGYGASGGAGGSGGNHSGAVCGSGGAGAGGSPWAGWGSYAANGMDSSWRRQYAEDISSQYQALGVYTYRPRFIGNAGKGGDGGSIGGKGTAGQNGYLYVYRFENVDETTDCGVLVDEITETIDCGELSETVTETIDCDLI